MYTSPFFTMKCQDMLIWFTGKIHNHTFFKNYEVFSCLHKFHHDHWLTFLPSINPHYFYFNSELMYPKLLCVLWTTCQIYYMSRCVALIHGLTTNHTSFKNYDVFSCLHKFNCGQWLSFLPSINAYDFYLSTQLHYNS